MDINKFLTTIDKISSNLDEQLGNKLVAFYLFGSVMILEDFHPGISDINTFIVLSNDSGCDEIEKIREIYNKVKHIPLAIPLILKESEIKESAVVFPIEFLEISEKNRLVRGKDVLFSLNISKEHIRRQCESELRAKIIGLRKMLFGIDDISKNLQVLYKSLTSTLILLKQVLRLKDITVPETRTAIIDELERVFSRKLTGMKSLYMFREKLEKISKPNIERLLKNYIEELEFFSEIINDEKII